MNASNTDGKVLLQTRRFEYWAPWRRLKQWKVIMHPVTTEQREALMALKDGPLPSEIFNAAHNNPSVSELFPDLVETGHSEIDDGIQAVVTLTENGHIALLSLLREAAVAQAPRSVTNGPFRLFAATPNMSGVRGKAEVGAARVK